MEHETFQLEIPEMAMGRLEGDARRRLEAHIDQCEDCARALKTAREIASAVHSEGKPVSSSHPDVVDLWRFAMEAGSPADPDVGRHIEVCDSCSLEFSAWRRSRVSSTRAGGTAVWTSIARSRWTIGASSLAAGVIVATLLWQARGQRPVPGGEWSGSIALVRLEDSARGDEAVPRLTIRGGDPYGLLEIQLDTFIDPRTVGSIDLRLTGVAGRPVWSMRMPAEDVARTLIAHKPFVLAVPSRLFERGTYELTLRRAEHPGDSPLLDVRFAVETEPRPESVGQGSKP